MLHVVNYVFFCLSAFNPAEVGADGKGYIWKASSLDDTEDEELSQCLWGRTAAEPGLLSQLLVLAQVKDSGLFLVPQAWC